MAEAKHTPGPWQAQREGELARLFGGPDGRFVARVEGASAADARLIAAAPELLEALQAFMALDRTFSTICDAHLEEEAAKRPLGRAVKLARAAIAKAVQS